MQVDIAGPSESALLEALRQAQSQSLVDGDGALTTAEICTAFGLDDLSQPHRRVVRGLLHKLRRNGIDIETVYARRETLVGPRSLPAYRIKQNSIDNNDSEC